MCSANKLSIAFFPCPPHLTHPAYLKMYLTPYPPHLPEDTSVSLQQECEIFAAHLRAWFSPCDFMPTFSGVSKMLDHRSGYEPRQIRAPEQEGIGETPWSVGKKESYCTGNSDSSCTHPLRNLRVLLVHVKGTSTHAKKRTGSLVLLSIYLGLSIPKGSIQTPTHIKGKSSKRSQL